MNSTIEGIKTNWLATANDLSELKTLYRKLALQYHPDRPGGSTQTMQEINTEFDFREKMLGEADPETLFSINLIPRAARDIYPDAYIVAAHYEFKLVVEDGELWAVGTNTYTAKEKLKALGFWWIPDEKAWKFVRKPRQSKRGAA